MDLEAVGGAQRHRGCEGTRDPAGKGGIHGRSQCCGQVPEALERAKLETSQANRLSAYPTLWLWNAAGVSTV